MLFIFFFQAEDGIRDKLVTGVQTCALPIYLPQRPRVKAYDPAPGGAGTACTDRRENPDRASGRVPGGSSNLRVASQGVNVATAKPKVSHVTRRLASRRSQAGLREENGRLRDWATPHVEAGEVREADLRQRSGGPEQDRKSTRLNSSH